MPSSLPPQLRKQHASMKAFFSIFGFLCAIALIVASFYLGRRYQNYLAQQEAQNLARNLFLMRNTIVTGSPTTPKFWNEEDFERWFIESSDYNLPIFFFPAFFERDQNIPEENRETIALLAIKPTPMSDKQVVVYGSLGKREVESRPMKELMQEQEAQFPKQKDGDSEN